MPGAAGPSFGPVEPELAMFGIGVLIPEPTGVGVNGVPCSTIAPCGAAPTTGALVPRRTEFNRCCSDFRPLLVFEFALSSVCERAGVGLPVEAGAPKAGGAASVAIGC